MKNTVNSYFLGLDIGTDSVGYAAADKNYNLIKFKGEPMWGVHLFDEASSAEGRRGFRTARRRLDRRQQRIFLLQSLFAKEIAKVDEAFFIRIKESRLFPEDTTFGTGLFADADFCDADYARKYPTIHHLILDLIENTQPRDVRLVYLACAWLVAHRGHFLNELPKEKIDEILDIETVYRDFMDFFPEDEKPWESQEAAAFGGLLKEKSGVNEKYKKLCRLLYNESKAPKKEESFYDRGALLKMLCGGKVAPCDLFRNKEYKEVDSFTLDKSDDELAPILQALGEDAELILKLKALFDWAVLHDVLQGEPYVSKAKIKVYEQHKKDLADLKYLIKKYAPQKYNEIFRRQDDKRNYKAYIENGAKQEDFCKYIKGIVEPIVLEEEDAARRAAVLERAQANTLCPKQVNSDNRVIPYQVYWIELKKILENASNYLPFLKAVEDGSTTAEKILSIFEFRIPYFVGPLNGKSNHAWIERKADGPIYPWNFKDMVDLDASEQAFIKKMTNTCTYLPEANVLPKMSLCYEKFQVLNEINSLAVNGRRIPVEVKQKLFSELFLKRRRITKKSICNFLLSNNYYKAEDLITLSGIDDTVKSSLSSHLAFQKLLESGGLTEEDAEQIIEQRTYTESKKRFSDWLNREYAALSEPDRTYLCGLKFKDFGRLSREFLCGLYGTETSSETGETVSVLERMWNENVTLMEVLSEKYTYTRQIQRRRAEYYQTKKKTLEERLADMYIPGGAARPIIRALDVVSDVVKANGCAPEKIFIEMARGGKPEEKGKRTKSRLSQIQELYKTCKDEEVRHLDEELKRMGELAENQLQSDRLFLYYMQLGRCMYTEMPIDLTQLSSKKYDIDHIYPRTKVKDDSVLNNKVLVLSEVNGTKGDRYPINPEIRKARAGWWKQLKENDFITEEKYKRLVRAEAFTKDEQWGFINRQLVETRQSTKAAAALLKERYPQTEIVYVKAGLVSEFRQEFDLLKSRAVNDLHHAKDAYLNVVVGNVYTEKFTKGWFLNHTEDYNLKIKTLFSYAVKNAKGSLVWEGAPSLANVKRIVQTKNAMHLTRYALCKGGGLFAQMPVPAKNAGGCAPLKKGLPPEKYGGYNKTAAAFFILVKYQIQKKCDVMVLPVELLYVDAFLADASYAEEYAKRAVQKILGKEVLAVSFPLGMRKIKIGTVFEADGCLRLYLTGKSGSTLLFSMMTPLLIGYSWEKYSKRLERLAEKKRENPKLVYSERYDEVSVEKNKELYALLLSKLYSPVYQKRPANPAAALEEGKSRFEQLDVFEQTKCLLQILSVFSRLNNGCDLSMIGGVLHAGKLQLNGSISNWKKYYSDVRLVDMSASGLYKRTSDNLLELL